MTEAAKDYGEEDYQNFSKFLMTRIQVFMMRMAEYVSLEKIIDFLQAKDMLSTYLEFKPTFEEKVKRETYNENILQISSDLMKKDLRDASDALKALQVSNEALLTIVVEGVRGTNADVRQVPAAAAVALGPQRHPDVPLRAQLPPAVPDRRRPVRRYELLQPI